MDLAVLLEDAADSSEAVRVAQRIVQSLREPLTVDLDDVVVELEINPGKSNRARVNRASRTTIASCSA